MTDDKRDQERWLSSMALGIIFDRRDTPNDRYEAMTALIDSRVAVALERQKAVGCTHHCETRGYHDQCPIHRHLDEPPAPPAEDEAMRIAKAHAADMHTILCASAIRDLVVSEVAKARRQALDEARLEAERLHVSWYGPGDYEHAGRHALKQMLERVAALAGVEAKGELR